jgi:AraC-like DNA-binding protein
LLRELEIEASPLIKVAGLSPELFEEPDNVMPLVAAARLLDLCAEASGLAHFGLLSGARNDLSSLGLIGHLAQSAQTVGEALGDLIRRLAVHDRGAQASLKIDGDKAVLAYIVDHPNAPGADQLNDGSIATIVKIMRGLCGADWRPSLILLPRRQPRDLAPYAEFFMADIAFGSDFAVLSFPVKHLLSPLPGANNSLHDYLDKLVPQAGIGPDSFAGEVRRLIRGQPIGGRPGVDRAAASLGMHRRTLARRLAAEGVNFRALVQDLRFEIADELLTKTDASMSRIAGLLGYSDQAAFSHAFVSRRGCPPSFVRNSFP